MVKVTFYQDKNKNFLKLEAAGHTDFKRSQPDIVCAGVSSLLQGAVLGLKKILQIKIKLIHKKGKLYCQLPKNLNLDLQEKAQILIKTLYLSLKEIEKQFPKNLKVIKKIVS